jgi:predicted lipid-binding transport protein (Tim44 family)
VRIDRLLNFLVQTDKLWDRQGMLDRARKVFMDVYLSQQGAEPAAVLADEVFPDLATSLSQTIRQRRQQGYTIEYRNLCVRKVELILVRNFADSSKDEFTARICAHAQRIISRNGVVVDSQEYVEPFTEYWTLGRMDGQWKLKEVLPEAKVRQVVGQENLDEGSTAGQLQWFYRQPRAG